jgi:hypothetical protein
MSTKPQNMTSRKVCGICGLACPKMFVVGRDLPGIRTVHALAWLLLLQFSTPMAHVPIPAGPLVTTGQPQSLPDGWTMHIHPEGKPFYHRGAREPEPDLLLGVRTFV